MGTVLRLQEVTKRFSGLLVNDHVSFSIDENELVGLIGPNGAGKTTLFNCISGYYAPSEGRVVFNETDITGWAPNAVCHLGLVRTFQVVRPIKQMTVLENVMIGSLCRAASIDMARQSALGVLEECGLIDKRDMLASSLTLVDCKRLEIARAWATKPRLLLLDEVMAGLTQVEMQAAVALVRRIKATGVALLIVEHVMEILVPLVDRMVVLDQGRKIAEGNPKAVLSDPYVISAYLGGELHAGS